MKPERAPDSSQGPGLADLRRVIEDISQRDKLERLCRYICRPPVSEKRLFLSARGDIGYTLKTPYRDGTR